MCLIFVHLLNNDERGEMTTPMCNSKQVKQLHGGRAGTRTPDLLRVKHTGELTVALTC
jgi:hypothetical protein